MNDKDLILKESNSEFKEFIVILRKEFDRIRENIPG